MTRVLFLIRSLGRGGAERQLTELVSGLARDGFNVTVCTFYDGGVFRPALARIEGVKVISLGKQSRWDVLRFLWRLYATVRSEKPDIIHAYMGVANELSALMAPLARARAVWGLRSSNMDLTHYDGLSRYSFRMGALLSRFAHAIIVNSQAGWEYHARNGYDATRMVVVHNGIDCEQFRPDPIARRRVRAGWGVTDREQVVGLVARLDPKKDHENFLRAAALTVARHPGVRFVCIGDGPKPYRGRLESLASSLGLSQKVRWCASGDDVAATYNGLDLLALSSAFGEGFPNVVGEAMATGRRCVVTDVGDAAFVVGDFGLVVPPRDEHALAAAMSELLSLSDEDASQMGASARARVMSEFSTRRLTDSTAEALRGVLKMPRR